MWTKPKLNLVLKFSQILNSQPHLSFPSAYSMALGSSLWELFMGETRAPDEDTTGVEASSKI